MSEHRGDAGEHAELQSPHDGGHRCRQESFENVREPDQHTNSAAHRPPGICGPRIARTGIMQIDAALAGNETGRADGTDEIAHDRDHGRQQIRIHSAGARLTLTMPGPT